MGMEAKYNLAQIFNESREVESREVELAEDLCREDESMEDDRMDKIAERIIIAPQQQYKLVASLRKLLDQVYL